MSLGDPAYTPGAAEVVSQMLSPAFNAQLFANASDDATRPSSEYGAQYNVLNGLPTDGGTTHFSIVDAQRNAVSLTSTINTHFGSKVSLTPSPDPSPAPRLTRAPTLTLAQP